MHPACDEPMRMPFGEFQGESRVWENRTHGSVGEVKAIQKRRAFTLVELLIVVAVLTLLASLMMPRVTSAIRQSRQLACLNQMKHLGCACTMYLIYHDRVAGATRSARLRDRLPL